MSDALILIGHIAIWIVVIYVTAFFTAIVGLVILHGRTGVRHPRTDPPPLTKDEGEETP